jgi:hypothetical protein
MPLLEIAASQSDGSGDGIAFALLYLEAVMLFPSDDAKRVAFMASAVADSFLNVLKDGDQSGDDGDERLPRGLVTWALNQAPNFSALFDEAVNASARTPAKHRDHGAIHGGLIAAHLILIPLVMHFRYSNSIGRGAAYRVITKWLSAKNRLIGANERNLQRIWKRYQSVAHLWGAFVLSNEKLPSSADELLGFLSLSELIRSWAEQYYPKHSRSPLLDGLITWRVPPDFELIGIGYDLDGVTMPDEWVNLATSPDVN